MQSLIIETLTLLTKKVRVPTRICDLVRCTFNTTVPVSEVARTLSHYTFCVVCVCDDIGSCLRGMYYMLEQANDLICIPLAY